MSFFIQSSFLTNPQIRSYTVNQFPERASQAYRELIDALGLEGHLSDPEASARLSAQLLYKLTREAHKPVPKVSLIDATSSDWVMLNDMPFYSLCEHHFVPFFGTATVEYLPDRHIAGLGSFFRLLEHFARRPQLQERLTQQFCDALYDALQPKAIRVTLRARQMCLELNDRPAITVETRAERKKD